MKIHPPLLLAIASVIAHPDAYGQRYVNAPGALHRDGCEAARALAVGLTDAQAAEHSPLRIKAHSRAFQAYCRSLRLPWVACAKALLAATPGMLAWWVGQIEDHARTRKAAEQ